MSNAAEELHVALVNCSPEDDARDITHTFIEADRVSGMAVDIANLEPVHAPKTSTDPVDAGFKRAVADGDLTRSFRTWAHTFITKAIAHASGLMAAAQETDVDWIKPAARVASFQATSSAAARQPVAESKDDESKFGQLLAAMARQNAQTDAGLAQMQRMARCAGNAGP